MHAVGSTAVPFTCARKEPQMRFSPLVPFSWWRERWMILGPRTGTTRRWHHEGDREDPDGGGDPWAGDNPARRDPWSDYVAPAPQAEAQEAALRDEPHDREARDWWDTSGSWGWSDWSWHSEEWGNSKWGSSASRWENTKPDLSDPPPWPGWSHYRLWKKAVERWNRSTDIPVWRRSDKLLKLLDWDLQGRFEYVPEAELASDKYLDLIFQVLDVLAGERERAEKRRAV